MEVFFDRFNELFGGFVKAAESLVPCLGTGYAFDFGQGTVHGNKEYPCISWNVDTPEHGKMAFNVDFFPDGQAVVRDFTDQSRTIPPQTWYGGAQECLNFIRALAERTGKAPGLDLEGMADVLPAPVAR